MTDNKVMVSRTLDMRTQDYSEWWVVEYRDPMNVHIVNVWQRRDVADNNAESSVVKKGSTVYVWKVLAAANEAGLKVSQFARANSVLLADEKSRQRSTGMSPLFAAPYGKEKQL
jgi:hypothetical protein